MTASVSELEEEIAHLRDLDLSGLRARWRSVFRRKAPDHLPRHLLYRMIAYRLQAERLGDLDRCANCKRYQYLAVTNFCQSHFGPQRAI